MDFGSAVGVIQQTIKRPDKSAKVKAAINRAIGLYTRAANWSADLVELSVTISSTEYIQNLDIATEFPNFRKMTYIRPIYADETVKKSYLKFLSPDRVVTPEGRETTNAWYRSGSSIIISLKSLAPTIYVGYYRRWDYLVANADTHWMLSEAFEMIHDKVCAAMFTDAGNDVEARKYEAYAAQLFNVTREDLETGADLLTAGT